EIADRALDVVQLERLDDAFHLLHPEVLLSENIFIDTGHSYSSQCAKTITFAFGGSSILANSISA
ncbi:MAG: hypothetical protein JXQ81_10125, partial [Desulfuromonadales bacterium]|nr:hypothetical protein [Desulfuromonadales bacterium]